VWSSAQVAVVEKKIYYGSSLLELFDIKMYFAKEDLEKLKGIQKFYFVKLKIKL